MLRRQRHASDCAQVFAGHRTGLRSLRAEDAGRPPPRMSPEPEYRLSSLISLRRSPDALGLTMFEPGSTDRQAGDRPLERLAVTWGALKELVDEVCAKLNLFNAVHVEH